MQLIGYGTPQLDARAVAGLVDFLRWTETTAKRNARRVVALAALIDRSGSTLDDVAELRRAAQIIAGSLSDLSDSAAGIDQNASKLADEIADLSHAAQGIDTHAGTLASSIDELIAIRADAATAHRTRRSA